MKHKSQTRLRIWTNREFGPMFRWAFRHAASSGGRSGKHYVPARFYAMSRNKYKNGLRRIRGIPIFAYQLRKNESKR